MKNLFKFVFIFGLLLTGFAFGQSSNKVGTTNETEKVFDETTRNQLATNVAKLKENVASQYQAGMSYETFRAKLLGTNNVAATTEGEALLNQVYTYLKNGTSSETIINSNNGVVMAKALKKSGGNDANIFATPSNQPHMFPGGVVETQSRGGCKWWQISCWVDAIFGAGTMAALVKILIAML